METTGHAAELVVWEPELQSPLLNTRLRKVASKECLPGKTPKVEMRALVAVVVVQ